MEWSSASSVGVGWEWGAVTFSAGLRVGPGGPSVAEEALPALSASLRGIGSGAKPAAIAGSTCLQAAQPGHRAVGACGAGLPAEFCSFRAVETCEGAGLGPRPKEVGRRTPGRRWVGGELLPPCNQNRQPSLHLGELEEITALWWPPPRSSLSLWTLCSVSWAAGRTLTSRTQLWPQPRSTVVAAGTDVTFCGMGARCIEARRTWSSFSQSYRAEVPLGA